MSTTIDSISGRGKLAHTAAVAVKRKETPPAHTLIWGSGDNQRTYSVTIYHKGQASHPKTQAEWDQFDHQCIAFLNTVNKIENFEGAAKIRFSSVATATVFGTGEESRVIPLDDTFRNRFAAPEDKTSYDTCSGAFKKLIAEHFTSTKPLELKEAEKSHPKNVVQAALADFPPPNAELTTDHIQGYLQRLQKDENCSRPLIYVSPIKIETEKKPNFIEAITSEVGEKEEAGVGNAIDNLVFAIPLLEKGHFKLVLLDFAKRHVYYYDSLSGDPTPLVGEALDELVDAMGNYNGFQTEKTGEWTRFINTKKHQTLDSTSCGYFVLAAVESIVRGKTFEDFEKLTFDRSNLKALKTRMAEYYKSGPAKHLRIYLRQKQLNHNPSC